MSNDLVTNKRRSSIHCTAIPQIVSQLWQPGLVQKHPRQQFGSKHRLWILRKSYDKLSGQQLCSSWSTVGGKKLSLSPSSQSDLCSMTPYHLGIDNPTRDLHAGSCLLIVNLARIESPYQFASFDKCRSSKFKVRLFKSRSRSTSSMV